MEDLHYYKKLYGILQEIANAVIVTDSMSSVANYLLDVAVSATEAESGSLMLLNDRDELYVLAARGLPAQELNTYRTRVGQGISGIVAERREPVMVQDVDRHPEFAASLRGHYKTKSFISCPILFKNKLLGVINVNDKRDARPFTDEELRLLQVIASHAAIAIENASLLGQLKSTAAELDQVNKRLIESDLLKTEFLTRISHELRTPLNSLKGAIYYLQANEGMAGPQHQEFQGIIAKEADNITAIVENLLQFLRIGDEVRSIKKTALLLHEVLRELPNTSVVSTEMKNRGIQLDVRTGAETSPVAADRIKVLQLFTSLLDGLSRHLTRGDSIEISIREDEYLYVDVLLSRGLPKSVLPYLLNTTYIFHSTPSDDRLKLYLVRNIADIHHWHILAENDDARCKITFIIPKNTKEVIDAQVRKGMDTFVEHIARALDLDICSIMLADDLTGELQVKSSRGLDDDVVKRTRIKLGDEIAGWVALEGKPLMIDDIERDARFARKNIPQYNSKSLMSLPLKVDGQVVGVINLNNKRTSEPFTRKDYDTAIALSEKLSEFLKRVYAESYREDDLHQVISAIEQLAGRDLPSRENKKPGKER
jgi:GAF domain-containing protein